MVQLRLAGWLLSLTAEQSRGGNWHQDRSVAAKIAAAEPHCVQASFLSFFPTAAAALGARLTCTSRKAQSEREGRGEVGRGGIRGRDSGGCPEK